MQIITKIIYFIAIIFAQNMYAQDYVISNGDMIDVKIFQNPDLDASLRVSESGRVNLPLIGAVNLEGKTEGEVEKLIEDALQSGGFINSPQVSVVVTEYSDRKASVLGKVHNPGEFSITSGDTIIDLISKAGGLTDDGNPNITLYRRDQDPITFNLYASVNVDQINQNSPAQSGDVLLVAQSEVFYTYGELNKPGEYILKDGLTVMQAISISGGLTNKASSKGIFIVRKKSEGKSETVKAALADIVQPFDVILVKESLF